MALQQQIKNIAAGGMDTDSAPEAIAPNDYITAVNIRSTGTSEGEAIYGANIEGTTSIAGTRPAGINKCIGNRGFEEIRKGVFAIYNSAGYHQIGVYDLDTNTESIIYTDKTDSAGVQLLNWDPKYTLNFILINKTYLAWADGLGEVGFTNLNTLSSGGYGIVTAEDLLLIKPQPLSPITATYINDPGRAGNFIKEKIYQFTPQWEGFEYNKSTWGTWSKRIIPSQESTPSVGTDSTQNNAIVVSVNVGSPRVKTIYVAARYDNNIYATIKTVERLDVIALSYASIDINNEVYEAYDPSTGIYSFIFYGDSISTPVAPVETDQFFDYIWIANAIERLNGNIIVLGDLTVGYARPVIQVNLQAVGYQPNLTVSSATQVGRMNYRVINPGQSGSGAGDHKRNITVNFSPEPKTNDKIEIFMEDIRDASNTHGYGYTVPSSQNNNLAAVINSLAGEMFNASYAIQSDGTVNLTWTDQPYFQLRNVAITLYNAGAYVSKSIHGILDNSSYQLALSYRDKFGRPFPLVTGNEFIVTTPSFAQLQGQTPQIVWKINSAPPAGAVDFQWLISKNTTTTNLLDVLGSVLNYKGPWDANANSPSLSASNGTVGDTYQVTTPNSADKTQNLGNGGVQYKTGDYVVYNGKSWDTVPKAFGDLTTTGNIIAIKINPLALFNQRYANNGTNTVLGYDFSSGDRCTLHYYFQPPSDPSQMPTKTYLNAPCVDLDVYGYDAGSYLLKVQKSSAVDLNTLSGKEIYLRVYSPSNQKSTSETDTEDTTAFYEIGERFTITNGQHDATSGTITDGDVYFKTRSYDGAVVPNNSYDLLATDFNFSDFYASAFTSYGRPRSYYDILEQTEQKASIIFSQNYISGSRNNGLSRFYAANLYGDGDGQTSSSKGAIQVLWERGDYLVVLQEQDIFYIPVNLSILQDAAEQKQYAISEKLLNNGRYKDGEDVGIGTAKESFCFKGSTGFFVDPNRSEPFALTLGGIISISGKMSKFFKSTIQLAIAQGLKIVQYYDTYYDEVVMAIQTPAGVLNFMPFSTDYWKYLESYMITPAAVTQVTSTPQATVSYDNTTGLATFTPQNGYVGNAEGTFSYNLNGQIITKNLALSWVQGMSSINNFSFAEQDGQALSTQVVSNSILVTGNNQPVAIGITGGQYSVNGGAYTSANGMVNSSDNLTVRVTSSSSYNTATQATLTISDKSATFVVKTMTQQPSTINYAVSENQNPLVDANLRITVNGTKVLETTGPVTGTLNVNYNDSVVVQQFSNTQNAWPTGANATLIIKKNNTQVFNNKSTTQADPITGNTYTFTSNGSADTYQITASSSAS